MNRTPKTSRLEGRSDFLDALRKGLLAGAAVLVLALPPALKVTPPPAADSPKPPPSQPRFAQTPAAKPAPRATPAPATPPTAVRLAQFGKTKPSSEVRQMANWVVDSRDHQRMAFVIVDKKDARVYVFDPEGRLQAAAPALLGQARGDDTVPGIGDKPIAEVLPEERTTPAGRFIAEIGMSSSRGEDVVWVDYDAAVSMHRVLNVKERLISLASPTHADNRMSYGCINLPRPFYEKVLRTAVQRTGAVIYVLPETRPMHHVFASFYDVGAPARLAGR
jgi:hypothetical protein